LAGSRPPISETGENGLIVVEELPMSCQGSLIYAHLALPELDPDEIRDGQIVTLLVALLVTRLLLWATMLF
jgi:hypothetical protein